MKNYQEPAFPVVTKDRVDEGLTKFEHTFVTLLSAMLSNPQLTELATTKVSGYAKLEDVNFDAIIDKARFIAVTCVDRF